MTSLRKWGIALLAVIPLIACEREQLDSVGLMPVKSGKTQLTFTATIDGAGTRTTLLDGTKIAWNPEEKINIFYGASGGSQFVSTNTDVQESVSFSGMLAAFTGTTGDGELNYFWAVYPYNAGNTSSGTSVSALLPDNQTGVLGNIPDNALLMVAKSPGLSLSFKQVCARLKVVVSRSDIRQIVIHANNDETIAGRVQIAMDGNVPEWTPITGEGSTEIVLMPSETTFEVGEYYLALLPQTLSGGFTMTCYTDETEGSYSTGAVTFERNKFKTVNTNKVTEWVPKTIQLPNEIWYTSSDGNPVDYTVTAATGNEIVSNTCTDGQGIIRFASDVTVIDESAFLDADRLTSVTLPEKVDKISSYAFFGCANLAEVNMGDLVRIIADYAFYGCVFPQIHFPENLRAIGASSFAYNAYLEEVNIPESVTTLGYLGSSGYYFYDNPFSGCTSLRKFTGKFATEDGLCLRYGNGAGQTFALVSVALGAISGTFRVPDGVTYIVSSAFRGAPITGVDLNEVVSIDQYAFFGSNLQSVTIPSTVKYIDDYAFARCNNMTDMWFESDELPRVLTGAFGGYGSDTGTRFCIHIPGMATITSGEMLLNATYDIESGGQTYTLTSYWYPYMPTDRIDVYQPDDEIWYHLSGEATLLPFSDLNFGTTSKPVYQTGDGIFSLSDFPWYVACSDAPSGIEWIGMMKFDGPVTAIPEKAFYKNAGLDWISLPNTVETIRDEAFGLCTALTSISAPNVTFLGGSAFANCPNLGSIHFPKVQNVQAFCFMDDTSIRYVSLPEAWFIGGGAFSGCSNLALVFLKSVQKIGNRAFAYTRKLGVMQLGSNLTNVGDLIFYDDVEAERNNGKLNIFFYGDPCPEIADNYNGNTWSWYSSFAFESTSDHCTEWPHIKFLSVSIPASYYDDDVFYDDFYRLVWHDFDGSPDNVDIVLSLPEGAQMD